MSAQVTASGADSWVDEVRVYQPNCGGCGAEYGDACPSLDEALTFVAEYPRCSSCEERG